MVKRRFKVEDCQGILFFLYLGHDALDVDAG